MTMKLSRMGHPRRFFTCSCFALASRNTGISPLRFAPVEMTNVFNEASGENFYLALATSTPKTYVGPNMLERKMTILLSGVKLTLGSSV